MLLQVYLIILGSINNTEKKILVEPQDVLYIFDVFHSVLWPTPLAQKALGSQSSLD